MTCDMHVCVSRLSWTHITTRKMRQSSTNVMGQVMKDSNQAVATAASVLSQTKLKTVLSEAAAVAATLTAMFRQVLLLVMSQLADGVDAGFDDDDGDGVNESGQAELRLICIQDTVRMNHGKSQNSNKNKTDEYGT